MNTRLFTLTALPAAALLAAVATVPAQAATVTFEYTQSFGAAAPLGSSPWATAVFDDGGSAGSVTLTMNATGTIGDANITQMYFNFDPSLDVTNLVFTYDVASTGPAAAGGGNNGIFTEVDAFQADGDGKYDILFDFPPPTGNTKWMAGETVTYTITSTDDIMASSFNFLSAPGGNSAGPFLSVARFQSTGPNGNGSDWVGAVPVPAAVWLFGSGLLGLVGVARKRRS